MRRQESAVRCALAAGMTPVWDGPPIPAGPRSTARPLLSAPHERLAPLAAASHDLRDSLQAIASYVELLADGLCGPLNADQRSCLARVRGHVDHLSAVVGSMLVLARAGRHGSALELSDVPVPELLADVRELVEPLAVAGGVSLVVDCERAPAALRGEPTALRRVLTNLAGNAVKFTPRGGRVSLSALATPHAVELRVADTGPGIPPAQLDAIFEPFVQVHTSDEVARRGAGLGLAIARELTHLMGGELFVRSAVGVGSLFTVRLPVAA